MYKGKTRSEGIGFGSALSGVSLHIANARSNTFEHKAYFSKIGCSVTINGTFFI